MNLNNMHLLSGFMNDLFKQIDDDDEAPIVNKIEAVVNVFETGKAQGDYSAVVVYHDGKGGTAQVTFGKAQTTEQGNLPLLLKMYEENEGVFAEQLHPYLLKLNSDIPLADDKAFIDLLHKAGREDRIMMDTQDEFFKEYYLKPAAEWFSKAGFTYPLSLLVIYDSFIHSGGILNKLRNRFAEKPPAGGGDEKKWISAYVGARYDWLKNNPNKILHGTVYRMKTFLDAIANDNWNLALPLKANGRTV